MVQGLDHGVPPTPSYISAYTPYTSANSGAILPVSDFVFNDYRQGYHRHRTSSLSQKMVHQHTPRVVCAMTDNQPYTGDIYNQVPTPQKTRVQSAVHSVSDFSHSCQGQSFCIHAPTVPNGATTFYNDHSDFVVLHHFPLSPLPFSGRQQQHTILIPPSPLTNNFFPVVCQDGPRTPNHDLKNNSPTGSFSVLEVAPGTIFPQRGLSTANPDPVPEHDHDVAVDEPIIDAVLSLREDQWPLTEQMYATVHTVFPNTGQYPTNSLYEPTQYDPDSLVTTSETATVSPCMRSPSPRPHPNASRRTLSPPSSGSLVGVFTLSRSRRLQDEESAESESSPEVQNSIDTSPTNSIQQSQTTNARMGEEPNFCHLCGVSFTQRQVYRRHLKDKHEDKESCPHCSSFKWSRGRPHLYRKHLELKHPQSTSSKDRPTRTRKHQAIGARQCKFPNGRIQSISGGLVVNVCILLSSYQYLVIIYSTHRLAKCSSRTHCRSYWERYW
ncbi:hypothetical protein EDB83DRAFT_477646 [Lactarius deliciosus]|nr:hypothetical protein EDB83DRAFT_477646 [Lactarius deliciosus]